VISFALMALQYTSLTYSCVWQMGYSSTLAVLGYVYLGETSTVLLRAKTTGVAAGSTGFLNLIVGYCSPLMLTSPKFGVAATSECGLTHRHKRGRAHICTCTNTLLIRLSLLLRFDLPRRPSHCILHHSRNKRTYFFRARRAL
jgi:hypothetical protein